MLCVGAAIPTSNPGNPETWPVCPPERDRDGDREYIIPEREDKAKKVRKPGRQAREKKEWQSGSEEAIKMKPRL